MEGNGDFHFFFFGFEANNEMRGQRSRGAVGVLCYVVGADERVSGQCFIDRYSNTQREKSCLAKKAK